MFFYLVLLQQLDDWFQVRNLPGLVNSTNPVLSFTSSNQFEAKHKEIYISHICVYLLSNV